VPRPDARAYVLVLGAAALCYAALGAVLRILPGHVGDDLAGSPAAVGLAVGAPALTAIVARPLGGRFADRAGPRPLVLGGALAMAAGVAPALGGGLAALDLSRLAVGAGEGAMMAAAVLWLLRLAGPARRGRALGHIGLANYAGLACGPLLADALGADTRAVFAAAIALPLLAAIAVLPLHSPPPPDEAQMKGSDPQTHKRLHLRGSADEARVEGSDPSLVRATLRPGVGLALVNVGYGR
jgi:MFS family permease